MPKTLTGTCFCRDVRYAVADEFRYAMNCHCCNCRRTTGSAFKPFAGIEREKVAVAEGGDKLMVYGDDKANDSTLPPLRLAAVLCRSRRRLRARRHGHAPG